MKLLKKTMMGLAMSAVVMNVQAADKIELEGAKVGVWTMDYDAAVELAGEKKLPLILNFTGSDWCGWCKLMDKNVFAEEVWKTYAKDNVLLVTLDFPRDKSIVPEKYVKRNEKLQEQFGVRGFPTYVVLDNDGKTKLGQLGAGRDKTPSTFIDEFKGVVRMSAGAIEAFLKDFAENDAALQQRRAASVAAPRSVRHGCECLHWHSRKKLFPYSVCFRVCR